MDGAEELMKRGRKAGRAERKGGGDGWSDGDEVSSQRRRELMARSPCRKR